MMIDLKFVRWRIVATLLALTVVIILTPVLRQMLPPLLNTVEQFVVTYDTLAFTNFGSRIVSGQNPYHRVDFSYPPTAFPLLSLWAIAPVLVTALVVLALNFALACLIAARDEARVRGFRAWWLWLLFFPVAFTIQDGQLPIVLFSIALQAYRVRKGWLAAFLAAVIAMTKPQDALILLIPMFIIWWRTNRASLLQFAVICLIWAGIPLVFYPGLYGEWLARMQERSNYYGPMNSPSFWSLETLYPFFHYVVVAAAIVTSIIIVLLASKRLNPPEKSWIPMLRILMVGIVPYGLFYQAAYLMLTAPVGLMVPVGLVSLFVPLLLNGFNQIVVLMPLTALVSWISLNRKLVGDCLEELDLPHLLAASPILRRGNHQRGNRG